MTTSPPTGLWFEDYTVGYKLSSPSRTITEADIVAFAGLSGDFNEIHVSEQYVQGERFKRRIAHGLLGLSIASGLAFQLGFMRGTVDVFRGLEWEFTGAIFIGDTVHAEIEVIETKAVPRLGNGKVVFKVSVVKQDGAVAQRGNWSLLVKSKPKTAAS
ncbi:MAG: MaoC/PaaZ C-terminal domain-containing protein [Anaerolineae bacterium]|nr:MaoC/PaaZ C-terminal domain-containing protein [Anaerolineae bacterium]